ncbi:MAG: sodium:calcium antiporter [Planctomycetota bacterium]
MQKIFALFHGMETAVEAHALLAWIVLILAFLILAKAADVFVESAAALAYRLEVPKLVIGIVLVSLATTAPELSVSVLAAVKGNPQMALGNAIGSVIVDDGLALALAGIVATAPILILPAVLRSSGLFLLAVEILCFLFVARDGMLSRGEGGALIGAVGLYILFLYRQHRQGRFQQDLKSEFPEAVETQSVARAMGVFALSLFAILLASELTIVSALSIAHSLRIPDTVIALTLVAFGTSIPEIATCVSAARKGHGAIAVGNILGADIMNICWVAGASALANDLALGRKEIYFMFPAMFLVVGAMLGMLRHRHRLTRLKGVVLLVLFLAYLAVSLWLFPPGAPLA